MFVLKNISKYYGVEEIIKNADLAVMYGDRIGIIGPNGSGKSTLLGILADEIEPDEGSVKIEKGTRIGVLHQEITRAQRGGAMDYLLANVRGLKEIEERKAVLLTRLEAATEHGDHRTAERLVDEMAGLDERYRVEGGYDISHEAEKILAGLGFRAEDKDKDMDALSGGWRMRLELARLLLEEPDALLLDEPTNHLDIASMKWLEEYLGGFGGSLVVVSHDRHFLNRTVGAITLVEDAQVRTYKGDYDSFREVRDMEIEHRWKRYGEQQARIKEIEDFIARNRVRKDRARVVQARIKMLERMERVDPPKSSRRVHFSFPQPERSGSPAVSLAGVVKRFGSNTVLEGLDLSILRGEKIALVGPNGSGKTTLLRIMAGETQPEEGRADRGAGVTVYYYAQHQVDALSGDLTVYEEMTSIAGGETVQTLRDALGAFLFSSDEDVGKRVASLSGGEKSRLALAKMMLRPASLILMDEPTNHLDIDSREILEEALRHYSGTLVFVSHDRRFINALAGRTIEIDGGRIVDYPGDYDYYEWKKSGAAREEKPPAREKPGGKARAGTGTRKGKARKRAEAERRNALYRKVKPLQDEMRRIEEDIQRAESMQKEKETQLASADAYKAPEKIKKLGSDMAETARRIELLYARWEELNVEIEKEIGKQSGSE